MQTNLADKCIFFFKDLVSAMSGALVLDPGKPAAMEEESNIDEVDSDDGEMVSLLLDDVISPFDPAIVLK